MINLLTAPIFDDEDKTLVARHLFIISWTLITIGWLPLILAVFIPETAYRWFLVTGYIETAALILFVLNKYGHTRSAKYFLIFTIWAAATGMALTGGGIRSNAMSIYLITVLIAGLVQSGKTGFITAVLCSLTGLFLVFLEYSGALPANKVTHTPFTEWIANTIYMFIIISFQYLVSGTIRGALNQSRQELKERKRVDAALRNSEGKLNAMILSIPDHISVINKELNIVWANENATRMFGTDIIGRKCYEAYHRRKEPCEPYPCLVLKAFKDGKKHEHDTEVVNKEGRTINFHCIANVVSRDKDNNPITVLEISHDITERKQVEKVLLESEERYHELSIIDDLTTLYNSRHFYFKLKIELERSNRYEQPLTLLLLDLDDFKKFNDTYGHIEGDQVLQRLGHVIKRCLRETDHAYRYGGEEFTILLPMTTSADGAVTAERIQTEFKNEIFSPVPGQEAHLTMSIGLAQYKQKEDMKAFVHRVDQLMYQAKKNGKDRVCSEL